MKVKIGELCAPFSCSDFQTEVEASLAAVDSCGQSVCIQIFPWEGVDAVTLMLRKEDGGAFSGSPHYGQFKLPMSAYEGELSSQQEARHTVALFVKEIEKMLSNYRG
jgi:hypothetical protein